MRFTIRDLLWLTVVVALGVAWWVDHANQLFWQNFGLAECRKAVNEANKWMDRAVAAEAKLKTQGLDQKSPNPSAPDANPPKD